MKRYLALFLSAAMLLGITACGKTPQTPTTSAQQQDSPADSTAGTPQDSIPQQDGSAASPAQGNAPEVHIRLAAWENIEWETFNGVYMTIKIPKGWEVRETGSPPYNFYRVSKPAEEGELSNTAWCTTNGFTFYHTQEWADYVNKDKKEGEQLAYATMTAPTTRAYFEAFWALPGMDVTQFDVVEEQYNGDDPYLKDYVYSEENSMKEVDNSSILAHWTQRGVEGTGLYSATIFDSAMKTQLADYSKFEQTQNALDIQWNDVDAGWYTAYGVKWFDAPTDEFENWLPILKESYDSQQPTEAYWKALDEYRKAMFGGNGISAGTDSYQSDDISDIWWDMYQSREKSDDIIREKRSDTILGYERVYDNDTGNIYKAYSGFMDDYQKSEIYKDGDDGTRYSYITDDQYTDGYSGWIDGYGDYLDK